MPGSVGGSITVDTAKTLDTTKVANTSSPPTHVVATYVVHQGVMDSLMRSGCGLRMAAWVNFEWWSVPACQEPSAP
jgi:hypothetical protein